MIKPIIGQEAVCPDGLGRVAGYLEDDEGITTIDVALHVGSTHHFWAADVQLVPICVMECTQHNKTVRELTALTEALRENLKRCVDKINTYASMMQTLNDYYAPQTIIKKPEDHYIDRAKQFIETLALDKL